MDRSDACPARENLAGFLAFHLSASDAELVLQLQLAPEFTAADFTAQQRLVTLNDPRYFTCRLVDKLQPEMPRSQRAQPLDALRAGLGTRVENRVAAPGIRAQRVLQADTVTQLDLVLVARTTAISIIRPG